MNNNNNKPPYEYSLDFYSLLLLISQADKSSLNMKKFRPTLSTNVDPSNCPINECGYRPQIVPSMERLDISHIPKTAENQ